MVELKEAEVLGLIGSRGGSPSPLDAQVVSLRAQLRRTEEEMQRWQERQ